MGKYQLIKKKMMKQGGILAGIIIALAAGVFFMSDMTTGAMQDQQRLRANIRQVASQISDLENKHEVVKSSILEYKNLKNKLDRGKFTISRSEARASLDDLRKRYRISNLSLSISPEEEMREASMQRETMKVMFAEVQMSFDALSDIHVYSFMQEFAKSLNGFVKISQFEISRQRKITNDVYISISKGEELRMVTAQIRFLWIGFRPMPKQEMPQ